MTKIPPKYYVVQDPFSRLSFNAFAKMLCCSRPFDQQRSHMKTWLCSLGLTGYFFSRWRRSIDELMLWWWWWWYIEIQKRRCLDAYSPFLLVLQAHEKRLLPQKICQLWMSKMLWAPLVGAQQKPALNTHHAIRAKSIKYLTRF